MDKSVSTSIVRATMRPSGKRFDVLPNQSLLEAGLGAGIALPFGCANGSCGDCRARITAGSTVKLRNHDYCLSEAQKLEGNCLLCSSTAVTDVEIEVLEAKSVNDIPEQQLQAKMCKLDLVNSVSMVTFKFIRGRALRFLPGQHATLTLPDGDVLTLPIASCPCNAQIAEFHLIDEAISANGVPKLLIDKIVALAQSRQRITISGPLGDFTLSGDDHRPKLFIAETGDFARLQGMIEQALNSDIEKPCCLLWIVTAADGHYRSNLCRSWHDAIDSFTFHPLNAETLDPLSVLTPEWLARLSECEVYMGNENNELIKQLVALGVKQSDITFPKPATINA